MLCPHCRCAAPGGSLCPQCGQQVPQREGFGGQGGRYLTVLGSASVVLFLVSALVGVLGGPGRGPQSPGWTWLCVAISLTPLALGLYYWFMLREEEVVVTDESISRRSRWGDESMRWSDVRGFRRRSGILPRAGLRLPGRVTRLLVRRAFPPDCYELLGPPGPAGSPTCILLEPGAVDDMPWLVSLIEERVGPPTED